jgi:tetratricopeptide (TPR) repeat protein
MHDVPLETISFTTTGQTYRALGQYSKALLFFQRSLPLAVKTKNIAAQATDTAGLGGINTDTGKYKIALPYDLQATALYARIGDQPSLEISGAYAGKAYQALNQLSNAASLYKQSLAASVICKDTDMQAYDLTNLAGVYTADGKFSDALDSDQQSLALDTKRGNQHNIELDLNNIGSDFSRLKKYSDAESYCLQSYKMAEKEGDKLRQHADLLNLAKLSFELGQHDKADKYAQQAAALGIK